MTILASFAAGDDAVHVRETLNDALKRLKALEPTGGSGSGAITLAIGAAQVAEEGGSVTFTVARGGDLTVPVVVNYLTGPTGSNPLNGADHVGGSFPAGTFTIPANATTGTFVVASAEDTAVEPDETGEATISSTTAGVTVTAAKAQYTFTNDDVAPGGTVIFGPATTGDTGLRDVGSANQRMEHAYKNGVVAGTYMFGLDAEGNGVAFHQMTDYIYQLRRVTAFSVGDPNSGVDPSIISGSDMQLNVANGAVLAAEIRNGRAYIYNGGVRKDFGGSQDGGFNVSGNVKGNFARYLKHAGSAVTDLQITRL